MPEIDVNVLHHLDFILFLGARSLATLLLHLLLLPQVSSKENDLKLHQAFYTIFNPLPVFHPSLVSLSHPRSTPIALGLEAMKPSIS